MARNFYRFIIRLDKIYKKAIEHNMAIMQSEYFSIINTPQFVETNLNTIKEVKENDIILLEKNGNIYAWGYAIKPRKDKHKSDKIEYLNVNEMINNILDTHGVKYISGKYNGIIYFNDCECFYNNLTEILENNKYGGKCWGQRVDIDKWRQHSENKGILSKKFDLEENPSNDIYKIQNRKTACKIIEELTGDIVSEYDNLLLGECIELLMQNRNLILTGAPGTGKTYLAKNIASQIILNKDYDESVENYINFKEQCAFVQFHPSYDYTDFVEGLRPMQDENGNIGFERKDGVFKEFCRKALKNLKDSEKDIATLNYDEIIKKYFLEFIENDIQSSIEKGGYGIKGLKGEEISPVVYVELKGNDRFNYKINSKQNNQYTNRENLNSLIECYKNIIIKNYDKITHKMLSEYTSGYTSSTYGILKAFYDNYNEKIEQEKNNITVQEVEKRDFVFIIDEINRGEISKIFGELFFSVDSGYRGEKGKVQTQYANLIEDGDEFKDGFYIPENVYIIGTMNDIDRSVESMDFAMRRRFAWKEIKAEDTQETILNDLGDLKDETIKRMNNLNKVIRNKETNLSEAYCIGAAYFKKIKDYEGNFNKLWENHLEGLLFEYTRGMPKQEEIIENFKKAYYSNNTKTENNNEEENANNTNN